MTTPVFPDAPRDLAVELYVGGGWQDITSDVYQRDPIRIGRGRANGEGATPPSSCQMTLNNRGGTYSPRNPMGPWYGSLGRNTPLRVAIRTAKDTFGRTVSGGWGTADVGGAWTVQGGGTPYTVGGGVGVHTISGTSTWLLSYLAGQSYRDVDVAVTVSLPFSNVSGGNVEPATLVLGGLSTSDYFLAMVKVTPAESVTVAITHFGGAVIVADTTVAGLTFSGQSLRARFQQDGQTLRAKVWDAAASEPIAWTVEGRSDLLVNRAAGWVGVRSGVGAGNTNTPVAFSYDAFEVRSNRFFGEVSNWPSQWDTSGNDIYTQIEAAGILRRLGQGQAPTKSTLYRGYTTTTPALLGYWPVEDGTESTEIASGIGGAPMQLKGGTTTFASNSSFAGSAPIAKSDSCQWSADIGGAPNTGKIQVVFLMEIPQSGESDQDALFRVNSSGTAAFWDLTYGTINNGSIELRVYDQDRILIHSSGFGLGNLNGQPVQISLQLEQDGADVDYQIFPLIPGQFSGNGYFGTVAGRTVGACLGVMANQYRQCAGTAFGHIAVRNYVTSIFTLSTQLAAYAGETTRARISRMCSENSVPFTYIWDGAIASAMVGVQARATMMEIINEAVAADMGSLTENRNTLGLAYRHRSGHYNQDAVLTLDYASGHLAPPFQPVEDDQALRNDITVTRKGGSSYQAQQLTGPLAVTEPSSGVGAGRYNTETTLNLAYDAQVPDAASWLVHMGTVDEARYPSIRVNVAKLAKMAPTLALDTLMVNLDDRIVIENPKETVLAPEDIAQIVRGYTEEIRALEHDIVFQATPASPYDVIVLDDDNLGKIDTDTSRLAAHVSSTGTQLLVTDFPGPGWTSDPAEMPIPITVSGEEMSVTAISAPGPSFVAAGVASEGSNAPRTPALPAGLAEGDALYCLTAIRNSPAGVPHMPADWTLLVDATNFRLFGKIAGTGEAAPTVTFTGGVANATCHAQLAAFRGCTVNVLGSAAQLNASAQNIAYPALNVAGQRSLILYLGWKQDDWTSVATIVGATEIGEVSTTTGDDAAFVWDYMLQPVATPANIAAGSFVVTGGAAAISRGAVVELDGNAQRMTVTRSVNGIVKPHAIGAKVSLARPAAIAL